MIVENALVLVIAGIFSMLALILTFYIGVEIVRLIREIFSAAQSDRVLRERARTAASAVAVSPSRSDGPEIHPFQDRNTVERLITHFEDEPGVVPAEED